MAQGSAPMSRVVHRRALIRPGVLVAPPKLLDEVEQPDQTLD